MAERRALLEATVDERCKFTDMETPKMSRSNFATRTIPKEHQPYSALGGRFDCCDPGGILRATSHHRMTDRVVKAGSDLFTFGGEGEAIYGLVDGWIALYQLLADGGRQILQFALPGAVLAFAPTKGRALNYSAQALTDAVVAIIPHDNLGRLAKDRPEMVLQLAGLISQSCSLAYDRLSSMGRRSARARVAHLLLELFVRSRMRWPGHRGEEMHLPLTQEHIGDATGLTNVHVNRVLRDLRKEGILEFHYRRLRILDPDKLVDVAGIDPQTATSWIADDPAQRLFCGRCLRCRRAATDRSGHHRMDRPEPPMVEVKAHLGPRKRYGGLPSGNRGPSIRRAGAPLVAQSGSASWRCCSQSDHPRRDA
jgi:CRP/FNR family transcriptional regulator